MPVTKKRGAPKSFLEGKLQKKDFRSRTPEEMAEIQRKAAEAKRKKFAARKAMREQLSTLLKMDVSDAEQKAMLKEMGVESEDMCNQMVLMVALFKKGAKGDVAAIKQIDDMTNGIVPEQSQPIVINIKSASPEVEASGDGVRTSKVRHDPDAVNITGGKTRRSVTIKQDQETEADGEAWPDEEDEEDWPDEE